MRLCVVCYLCLLALERVISVPSTLQPSCGTELVRVERGSTLSLHCGSYCSEGRSGHYTWWRVTEEERGKVQLSFSGAVVTEDRVTEESGGEYECQCGHSGQICTFYVAVLPEVTFTVSHPATHYGDVVTLTCLVEGNPANHTTITNSYGILLQSQVKRKINSFRLETIATVSDLEEEDYECHVEVHYKGHPVTVKKQSLKIKLYDPPSIMYTTEYVLHRETEFGLEGHLSCVVQTSSDTESFVSWWAGGELLEEGGKYRMMSSVMSSQVTVFRLEFERVEEADIGPYLCQLSTQYNMEETQEAWIKVDYRNEASVGVNGGTVRDGDGSSHDSNPLGHSSASSLRSVAVLVCLCMVAGLGTWGVVARRRAWRKTRGHAGIIGGGWELPTPSASPSITQSRVSVFKRK